MANVNCYGSTISSRGGVVPLHNSATTEATQDEVRTDGDFVGSVQVFGTFATQQHGQYVLTSAGLQAENDFTWAYVQSAGKIKAALPIGGGAGTSGGNCGLPAPIPYPKTIASGDSIQVMVNAGTDREAAVSGACTNGEYHVFSVTPGGAGEHEFVSVLDGTSSIGETLQGRTITHWFATSGNNDAELTSGPYLLNGSGVPAGAVGFCSSGGSVGATFQPCRHQVALTYRMVFRTDA